MKGTEVEGTETKQDHWQPAWPSVSGCPDEEPEGRLVSGYIARLTRDLAVGDALPPV